MNRLVNPAAHVRSAKYSGLVAVMLFAACGGSEAGAGDDEAASVSSLVVGSTADRWGLLTLPRGGGPAELRPVGHPDSVVWTGSTELPVARDLRPVGDRMVVLLAEDGRVLRYDPLEDAVSEVVRLSPEATFVSGSGASTVLIDSAGRDVHVVGPESASRFSPAQSVSWAAAFDGGLALLTTSEPPRLRLIHQADGEVVLDVATGGAAALMTAWGQRVVAVGEDGRHVRIFATDDGSLVGEVHLGGRIRALAASPSSHEIYASTDDPPRLFRIGRVSLAVREVGEFASSIEALRPGLFGGAVLVQASDGIGQLAAGESTWRSLAGAWRSDLPLSLPGDRTIVLRDDEAHQWTAGEPDGPALAGGAPAWWIPVRREAGSEPSPGRPAPPQTLAQAGSDGSDAQPGSAVGRPGYYAIVASARQRGGVETLLARLAESGYATRIHRFPDEAGNSWFRGLVGPYTTRARALAAARQLRRERNLQAWVTELGGPE